MNAHILLNKWSQLAPKECKIQKPNRLARLLGATQWFYFPTDGRTYHPDREADSGKLLAIVIDAIQRRGWEFDLQSQKGTYTTVIYGGVVNTTSTANSPAASLIFAYLQVLKKQKPEKTRLSGPNPGFLDRNMKTL